MIQRVLHWRAASEQFLRGFRFRHRIRDVVQRPSLHSSRLRHQDPPFHQSHALLGCIDSLDGHLDASAGFDFAEFARGVEIRQELRKILETFRGGEGGDGVGGGMSEVVEAEDTHTSGLVEVV